LVPMAVPSSPCVIPRASRRALVASATRSYTLCRAGPPGHRRATRSHRGSTSSCATPSNCDGWQSPCPRTGAPPPPSPPTPTVTSETTLATTPRESASSAPTPSKQRAAPPPSRKPPPTCGHGPSSTLLGTQARRTPELTVQHAPNPEHLASSAPACSPQQPHRPVPRDPGGERRSRRPRSRQSHGRRLLA
jgi:hypothetical protein